MLSPDGHYWWDGHQWRRFHPARDSRGSRRGDPQTTVILTTVAAVVTALVTVLVITGLRASIAAPITRGGQSSDGSFAAGDCVLLAPDRATWTPCDRAHDGRVIAVAHRPTDRCPDQTDVFHASSGTGNLCIDRQDRS